MYCAYSFPILSFFTKQILFHWITNISLNSFLTADFFASHRNVLTTKISQQVGLPSAILTGIWSNKPLGVESNRLFCLELLRWQWSLPSNKSGSPNSIRNENATRQKHNARFEWCHWLRQSVTLDLNDSIGIHSANWLCGCCGWFRRGVQLWFLPNEQIHRENNFLFCRRGRWVHPLHILRPLGSQYCCSPQFLNDYTTFWFFLDNFLILL